MQNTQITNIESIINLLTNSSTSINDLIIKANIKMTPQEMIELKNILEYIIQETDGKRKITNIIDNILEISSDGKIELYEIPQLINVLNDSLTNITTVKISLIDIGILLKIIIFILIETKTINLPSQDLPLINKLIDTSTTLLNKSINIKIPKKSKINKCLFFKNK